MLISVLKHSSHLYSSSLIIIPTAFILCIILFQHLIIRCHIMLFNFAFTDCEFYQCTDNTLLLNYLQKETHGRHLLTDSREINWFLIDYWKLWHLKYGCRSDYTGKDRCTSITRVLLKSYITFVSSHCFSTPPLGRSDVATWGEIPLCENHHHSEQRALTEYVITFYVVDWKRRFSLLS